MPGKLGAFAARVSELGWLAALLVTPLFFNLYTERLFEEDKIPLMRSLALLVAVALVIGLAERGREALRPDGTPLWKLPAVPATLALLGAYVLSTVLSVAPRFSLWGGYIRRQGLFTWVAYLIFFASILLLVRRRPQVERIISTVILTSIPVALYALLQNRGLDPLPWGGDVVRRASSTLGNPIFLGAYLIMVVPLTLVRLIERARTLLARDEAATSRPALMAGLYLALLLIQLLALIFSQSRGPLLGLLVGLTLFGTLLALRRSRRLTIAIAVAAVAGSLFLALFNQPNSPLAPLREAPYIGRLGRLFEVERGTGRVRTLIWEGDAALVADAPPLRKLVGYGPETMTLSYNPYYPPELAQVEKRNRSPDRSHNETFDALVTLGIVGLMAQVALFLALFAAAFRWLGMIRTPRQGRLFIGGAIVLGAIGWLLPMVLDGSIRYSGVAMPAAITLWLLIYAIGFALRHLREPAPPLTTESVLVVALLSAIVAHFVEIHFGIAIAATRLHFWLYAALLVLFVAGWVPPPPTEALAEAPRRGRRAPLSVPVVADRTVLILSLVAGLMLAVLLYNFVTPLIPLGAPLVLLIVASWLLAGLLVVGESASPWSAALRQYLIASLLPLVIFALVYIPWSRVSLSGASTVTVEQLVAYGYHIANQLTLLYLFAIFWAVVAGWWLARREGTTWNANARTLLIAGLLVVALPPAILRLNLDSSRADSFSKQGSGYEGTDNWAVAGRLYQEALRLQPTEDRYFLNLGRALLEQGRRASGQEREAYFSRADQVLTQAQLANPLNPDHARNLASLHRVWASLAGDLAEQQRHRELANRYYEEAVMLSPNNARLYNEWATLLGEMEDSAGAHRVLERSLALDDQYVDTYLLLANQAILDEQYDQALDSYDQALALDPASRAARGGIAYVYSLKGEPREAIRRYEAILVDLPDDYVSLKNLAVLYRDAGDPASALAYARRALPLAPDNEYAAVAKLIADLEAEQP